MGYFYNFSGHLDIQKHYNKALEIANKHGYDISTMFEFEVQVSSKVKFHQIFYSSQENQEAVDGATVWGDINDYLK